MQILETKKRDCKPKILNQVHNWLNYLLPATCLLCGQGGYQDLDLCFGCYQQLSKNDCCCQRCGSYGTQTELCGDCLTEPRYFDRVQAPFLYQDGLRYLITHFKYQRQYSHARTLGLLLARQLDVSTPPDCLIPVPLHKSRYRQRGFNQAIEMAKVISKVHHIPVQLQTCIRQRNTAQQVGLSNKQRKKNIKNAFVVLKPVADQHIALIDDVMTTGSTANELAKVLKKAGAKQVDVWLCARA